MPEDIMNILLLILLAVAFIIPQIIKSARKKVETVKKPPLNFSSQNDNEEQLYKKRFDPITGEAFTSRYDSQLLEEQKAQAEFNEDLTKRKLEVNIKSEDELSHLSHLHSNIEESGKKKVKESHSLRKSEVKLEEKLNRLSPLKRAIVMSEILNQPKGLE